MTPVIWKDVLPLDLVVTLRLPKGARILHVGEQNNIPYLWYLCDPSAPDTDRHFRVVGTGWNVAESNLVYIGTMHLYEGHAGLVFHVFEDIFSRISHDAT